jgi:hypothetical protein
LADIVAEPLFVNLRADHHWPEFLDSIGKGAAQLDTIRFEVSLPQT